MAAKVKNEPVFVTEDGQQIPYVTKKVKNHHQAFSATLHLVFQHTADVYMTMMEIVADKYGFNSDDMIKAVMEDPRFNSIMMNPALSSLNYFKKENMERVVPPAAEPKPTLRPKVVIRKKATAPSAI
jgi:hypothetical protein